MKVFIDILTPKQCMLFSKVSERLRMEGHQVYEATRDYREVIQLLQSKKVDATVVGRYGGGSLQKKLEASIERILQLTSIMKRLKPDVALSFSSPETARVAFGLNIPHICLNDSPHAEAVARLTIPLSQLLLSPHVIPKSVWAKFGIPRKRIIQYKALDAWAWLKNFKPNEQVLASCGLDKARPIIAFRPEESFASYLLGKTNEQAPSLLPLIERLLRSRVNFQGVVIPRYKSQLALLEEKLGKQIVLCQSTIDAPSLLSYASVFVGAGGTMTTEAALLGVPTFSCYPDNPFLIERFLIKEGLITRETNLDKLTNTILKTLSASQSIKSKQAAKARHLTDTFEDPIDNILEAINNFA